MEKFLFWVAVALVGMSFITIIVRYGYLWLRKNAELQEQESRRRRDVLKKHAT